MSQGLKHLRALYHQRNGVPRVVERLLLVVRRNLSSRQRKNRTERYYGNHHRRSIGPSLRPGLEGIFGFIREGQNMDRAEV